MTKSIWFKNYTIDDANAHIHGNASEHMGIQITEMGLDHLVATMPVNEKTRQPMGVVHGGANVLLAETVGSIGANLVVDPERFYCVGQEVNANHVRAVRSGEVKAIASLLYRGRTSQVWDIKVYNEHDKLSCVSRLTMSVQKRPIPTPE